MLHWSSELYIGEGIRDRAEALRRDLDEGKPAENAWLITLSTNRQNQLDLVHTLFLRQAWIRKSLPLVVGIAASKREAMNLVTSMLMDSLGTHCGTDMRAYLVEKHHTVM